MQQPERTCESFTWQSPDGLEVLDLDAIHAFITQSYAHGLYEKFGFRSLRAPEGYMELWEPQVYARLATEGTP